MNKFGMALGAAAVAVVAGCKDPNYSHAGVGVQNEAKDAAPAEAAESAAAQPAEQQPVAAEPSCACPPGTRHEVPCACGAADCACVVTPKAVKAGEPEPESAVYVVQNGDYLAKISKRFNVTIASIKRVNGLKSDMIRVGQKLKIPGKVDVGAQAASSRTASTACRPRLAPYSGATKEYSVKGGDTLGGIAHAYGIGVVQLKEMNALKSDVIRVGQKLKVPAEKVVKAKPEKKPAAADKAPAAKAAKADAKPAADKAASGKDAAKPAEANGAAADAEATEADAVDAADAKEAAPAAAVEAAPAAEPKTFEYTVQEGEDFTAVTIQFGVGAAEIRALNGLGENDVLKAGQKIKLPIEAKQ